MPRRANKLRTVQTLCKVGACEPCCGIEVDIDDSEPGGKMVAVRPDKEHPLSQGYACIKGLKLLGYQNSPDRLTQPMRRDGDRWVPATWREASEAIGGKLRALADQHGPRSISTYWGNAADSVAITMANTFCHAFGSPNSYNVLSLEYTDRGVVAHELYGNENLVLQPDVVAAKFAILLGTNPMVTQGLTLLQRRPHVGADLKKSKAAGGKLVVVDPRRTQTAALADWHVAIRPGTDLYFLLALIRTIVDEGLYDESFLAEHTTGFEIWKGLASVMTPERAEEITTVPASTTREIARQFAAADGAYVSTRVGVQTSHNTVLTEWAVATLCAITGNIDRPGGLYHNPGVLDVSALIEKFTKRKNTSPSRIGNYPHVFGGLPCTVLPDEILTPGDGQVRALVVIAGNPVISFPNTAKIEAALEKLELLVSVDIFLNDTASFADWVLPAATQFETGGFHFLVNQFDQQPYAELRPKLVEPPGEARGEWDIFKDLSRAAGVPFLNNPTVDRVARMLDAVGVGFSPTMLNRYLLLGKTPSYGELAKHPRGLPGKPMQFGTFFTERIYTQDRKIHLAPEALLGELGPALHDPPLPTTELPFLLISGARRSQSFNSWTHNIPELVEKLGGNWATVNDADGARLGIDDGSRIKIRSAIGEIEVEARLCPKIAPGVVAVHQHWGHTYDSGMTTANKYPGVNVNRLHDDAVRDPFCAMPVFNGTPVAIKVVE
ncbi:MAG: molybdopterin-containing oxidoreductase family protein [Nannocystales bacterium]